MTTHITVKATVHALGLRRGDVAVVELTPTTDAMVDAGYWLWLDAPEPAVEVTEVVKARKPKAKSDGGPATPGSIAFKVTPDPVHSLDYTTPPEDTENPFDNVKAWEAEGGSSTSA